MLPVAAELEAYNADKFVAAFQRQHVTIAALLHAYLWHRRGGLCCNAFVKCREEESDDGPVVVYQTVYFEDVSIPSWIVNPAVGHMLWGTVRGFTNCLRDFQRAFEGVPEGTDASSLAAAVHAQQAARQSQAAAARRQMSRGDVFWRLTSRAACLGVGVFIGAALQRPA